MAACYLAVDLLIYSEIRFDSYYTSDAPTSTLLTSLGELSVHLLHVHLMTTQQQHWRHLPASTANNMQDDTERTATLKEGNLVARTCGVLVSA